MRSWTLTSVRLLVSPLLRNPKVSGTFNPPHRGHLRLGLFAKERLEKLGHRVEARVGSEGEVGGG